MFFIGLCTLVFVRWSLYFGLSALIFVLWSLCLALVLSSCGFCAFFWPGFQLAPAEPAAALIPPSSQTGTQPRCRKFFPDTAPFRNASATSPPATSREPAADRTKRLRNGTRWCQALQASSVRLATRTCGSAGPRNVVASRVLETAAGLLHD